MHPEIGMIIYHERLREIEQEHHVRQAARERAAGTPSPARDARRVVPRRTWHGLTLRSRTVAEHGGPAVQCPQA